MARQKKNGRPVSFYIDKGVMQKVEEYAELHGQTLTKAIERLVEKGFAAENSESTKQTYTQEQNN